MSASELKKRVKRGVALFMRLHAPTAPYA
jgi:hypothetical protein